MLVVVELLREVLLFTLRGTTGNYYKNLLMTEPYSNLYRKTIFLLYLNGLSFLVVLHIKSVTEKVLFQFQQSNVRSVIIAARFNQKLKNQNTLI